MSLSLLSSATTVSQGTGVQLTSSPSESFNIVVTATGSFVANVQVQSSSDNSTWTTIKTWNVSGVNNFSDSFSVNVATSYYVRGIITGISGTSTSVTLGCTPQPLPTSLVLSTTDPVTGGISLSGANVSIPGLIGYSDFSGVADGTNIAGYLPGVGPAFTLGGGGTCSVQSGFAVPGNTNVYYATQAFSAPVTKAVVELAWSGTTGTTTPGFNFSFGKNVANPGNGTGSNPASGVANLIHCTIINTANGASPATSGFAIQVREVGGSEEYVLSGVFASPMKQDGTVYRIELIAYGNGLMLLGPFGECFATGDIRVRGVLGNNAFFEANIAGDGSYSKVKRFWCIAKNTAANPAGVSTPEEMQALYSFAHNSDGQPTLYAGSPAALTFTPGAVCTPQILFGNSSYFVGTVLGGATIGSAIAPGNTSFLCDIPLPNGVYGFDYVSANGAQRENVTVSNRSGATLPYTITCSAFALAHNASSPDAPVMAVSTFKGTAVPLYVDQYGALTLPAGSNVNGALRIGGYSTAFQNSTTNYLILNDQGPGNPTSLGVTGGLRTVEGANHYAGVATLAAGTNTVSTTAIATGDRVTLHRQTAGGTLGHLSVGTITNGTSFVITSSSGTETSTVYWEIRRPG